MPPARRRPRGHVRELPSGSYQAIVYAGTDPLTRKPTYLREPASVKEATADGVVSALRLASIDFQRAQLTVGISNVHPKAGVIEKETKSGTRPRIGSRPAHD